VALALAWGAPAAAVIIASGDGTGNTSAPPDDPGWRNVVNISETGVYLGNGWVLTANHVGADTMFLDGEVYEPVPDSEERLVTNGPPDTDADLLLFQIVRDPGLPDVPIRTSSPVTFPPWQASEVVMIGRGRSRGATTSGCSSTGWKLVGPNTMRWGTNVVYQKDIPALGTILFNTSFSQSGQTDHEAQVASGDSGGAVFIKNETTSEWELAGIMIATLFCRGDSAIYGDFSYAADLSEYDDQIEAIASVPACNDGVDQDGDGYIDWNGGPQGEPADPGCDDLLDPFETSDALPCDDGIDNDGDGGIDFDPVTYADPGDETTLPAGEGDPGCGDPTWSTESPECQDGIRNDGDGMMDYDAGLFANGSADPAGPDPQCVGKPWRDREAPYSSGSYPCGLGAELALLLPALMWMRRRRA